MKFHSVSHEGSGIVMDVYTNQPGLEVYSGWFVDVPVGKHGHTYIRGAGLGLEAQNYPDAPNHVSLMYFIGYLHKNMMVYLIAQSC